ncbi:MAG: hypothetical protein V1707_01170 [bacterium]
MDTKNHELSNLFVVPRPHWVETVEFATFKPEYFLGNSVLVNQKQVNLDLDFDYKLPKPLPQGYHVVDDPNGQVAKVYLLNFDPAWQNKTLQIYLNDILPDCWGCRLFPMIVADHVDVSIVKKQSPVLCIVEFDTLLPVDDTKGQEVVNREIEWICKLADFAPVLVFADLPGEELSFLMGQLADRKNRKSIIVERWRYPFNDINERLVIEALSKVLLPV